VVPLAVPGSVAGAATAPDQWTAVDGDSGNAATNAGEHVITAGNANRLRTAWTSTPASTTPLPPMVFGGVVYHVVSASRSPANPSTFTATSAATGKTLWTLTLPGMADYDPGMAATGSRVLISFIGSFRPGGVLAVDVAARRIAWSSNLPPATLAGSGNAYPGQPYTDGSRVYVAGSGNAINTYRLRDGALLWTAPTIINSDNRALWVDGIAVGAGVVYTGGLEGLVAYDAATGHRRWKGLGGSGTPVVAGGRVFALYGGYSVRAFPAAGCGKSTCGGLWTHSFGAVNPSYLTASAADASNVFVTYTTNRPGGSGACTSGTIGHVARLSATSGAVKWTTSVGSMSLGLIHGGSTIWMFNEFVNSSCAIAERIIGFSAAATGSAPLRAINLPPASGYPQSLVIASGTLFEQTWIPGYLIAYRVPGT
jgi:hypothetical protein